MKKKNKIEPIIHDLDTNTNSKYKIENKRKIN